MDTQNGAFDGTDLTENWGEENLDLDGSIDTEWERRRKDAVPACGGDSAYLGLSTVLKMSRTASLGTRERASYGLKRPSANFRN